MTEDEIARQLQLMACAAKAGPSEQKRAAFTNHLVQLWLIGHIGPWLDKRLIDDTYADRKGGGTHRAIVRLQHFMRQPGHRWYCQLDIQAFFPSIERARLLAMWCQEWRPRLPFRGDCRHQLNQVAQAILSQDPLDPPPTSSGDRRLLRQVPHHKSLYGAAPGVGLPIGSLTSQCFANLYLGPLDQFVKHRLKVKGYLRYKDDMILLADDAETLVAQRQRIAAFLGERLGLALHPRKMVLQRVNQGANFLGAIAYPFHSQVRQRLRAFQALLEPARPAGPPSQLTTAWQRWLRNHPAWYAPGVPNPGATAAHAGHPQQLLRPVPPGQYLSPAPPSLSSRTAPLLRAGRCGL